MPECKLRLKPFAQNAILVKSERAITLVIRYVEVAFQVHVRQTVVPLICIKAVPRVKYRVCNLMERHI